jgi:hypothetical protein
LGGVQTHGRGLTVPQYAMPMTPEQEAALAAMPRLEGCILNLFYVPPKERNHLEGQWRQWCGQHPRHLWPDWLTEWAQYRKSGHVPRHVRDFREAPP